MLSAIVKLLRFASVAICLIVIASFGVFAIDQTKTASSHQQEAVTGTDGAQGVHRTPVRLQSPAVTVPATPAKESSLHKHLDDASSTFTSPFEGIVSAKRSEWAQRGVALFLALLVYGFGLGYVARVLRVRV